MGSLLSAWLESMLPLVKSDGELDLNEAFEKGLANAVKGNDSLFPPEWRMSFKARQQSNSAASSGRSELSDLHAQIAALREKVIVLEQKVAKS